VCQTSLTEGSYADRRHRVSDGSDTPQDVGAEGADEENDLQSVEIVTAEVEEDGTIVVDDLVAEVDGQGNVVATDELVEIDLPDGTVIMDETFSVANEEGELVVIDEETIVLTPGDDEVEAEPAPTAADSNGNSGT
jgi:hypothetical protein